MPYYPLMLDLSGKACLVVGGGEVALRKARSLIEAGAYVTVIAPEIEAGLEDMKGVTVIERDYREGDASGYTLVFAATDSNSVNTAVSEESRRNGIPVNIVDDPGLCSFIVPSVVRRGDFLIAISTSGKSPSLSKKVRRELEERYGNEYAEFVDLLGELRELVKSKYGSHSEREAAFTKLLNNGILELLSQGKNEQARERALKCI